VAEYKAGDPFAAYQRPLTSPAADPFAAYQKPLTDPDTWLAARQHGASSRQLEDPDAWLGARQQGAAPGDGWKIWQATSDKPAPQSYAQKLGSNIWNAIKGTGQLVCDVGAGLSGDPMATHWMFV
jgi:hypothetical protein